MKKILILLTMLLFISCNDNNLINTEQENIDRPNSSKAINDTVSIRLTNVSTTDGLLKFDLECKLNSSTNFTMGSSTFAFDKTNLINPIISNINSRYTVGNGNGYYQMMIGDYGNQVVVQIIYLYPPGNNLLNSYERIATVTMEQTGSYSFNWNDNLSYIIKPDLTRAKVLFQELTGIRR